MKLLSVNDSVLFYRETPWDKRVFGVETIEIMKADFQNEEEAVKLLSQLEGGIEEEGLIYFRNDSRDLILKKIMIANNYYVPESSLRLNHRKIQRCDFGSIYSDNLCLIDKANDGHVNELKDIAKTAFSFSRFHEDPFLDIKKSIKRYEFWIDDLIRQGKRILLYVKNDEVISFMFYEYINDERINLILGGSKNGYGVLMPLFISSVLTCLKGSGVKAVDVTISASNIAIFNMYVSLGFQVIESMFDYHKIIKKVD